MLKRIQAKRRPGEIRDAIIAVLSTRPDGATLPEISARVIDLIGAIPSSSVRSYLRLNTPELFTRLGRAHYVLRQTSEDYFTPDTTPCLNPPKSQQRRFAFGKSTLFLADCFEWLREQKHKSLHAVVTDPPYGLFEYSNLQQQKLRLGKGGVWRIPPSFDGTVRSPLPRFTVLKSNDLEKLATFFYEWTLLLMPVLVPGANVIVATNPLLSYIVATALARGGLERRGEIVRLTMTMRGGDRPKDAHDEFSEVSVMPRSMWEPWLVFRKPLDGRVQDNLRKWMTGGFRRPSDQQPFGDVIQSSPTGKHERTLAPHPSLKPQDFLRRVVRGVLPLGKGLVLDPFAGSGSTLAAAEANGYSSIGIEQDEHYFDIAVSSIQKLAEFRPKK